MEKLRSSRFCFFDARAALLVVIAVVIVFVSAATAGMYRRPIMAYPSIAMREYSWMCKSNRALLTINVSDDTKKFMSEADIRRYINLKMRNFIIAYKLTEEKNGIEQDYMWVEVEMYKYNDNLDIYTGLFAVGVESAVSQGSTAQPYIFAVGISGADTQIVEQIKSKIDWFVEMFAEDYYMVQDLDTPVDE